MDIKITADTATYWMINDKYQISKNDGHISFADEEKGELIPQEVYDERDRLIFNSK